ncbi:MAG: mechanosensitive ion channel family protein [Chitinophagaceae bacterium]|nr:mechanosensitive ion channel family protein [Chitinophagaceae bacterium]MCB9046963.1 mechanosensitive ion channel family protein [Chitinophagales bacterium]
MNFDDFINKYLYNETIGKLAVLILGVAIIWTIIRFIKRRLVGHISNNDYKYKTRKMLDFAGYMLMVILLTIIYRDKLGGLTIMFGVAGAGIAIALQEVIASVAGWLTIMFAGFYKTGDRVQVGGIKGDVVDIGVLRTTIMETGEWVDGDLYNGRIVFVANSFVFKEPVFNYSGEFPFLWDEIKIPVQYGSDYAQAEKILLDVAGHVAGDLTTESKEKWNSMLYKYKLEDAQTAPMVSVVANENWVEFTLRYVVLYKRRRRTKTELFTQILAEIEKPHSKVKITTATLNIGAMPHLDVEVKNRMP